jgi:hypothetical protein
MHSIQLNSQLLDFNSYWILAQSSLVAGSIITHSIITLNSVRCSLFSLSTDNTENKLCYWYRCCLTPCLPVLLATLSRVVYRCVATAVSLSNNTVATVPCHHGGGGTHQALHTDGRSEGM